jgi:PAS domain S-box-containing protein
MREQPAPVANDQPPAPDDQAELRRRMELLETAMDVSTMAAWRWDRRNDVIHLEWRGSADSAPRLTARTLDDFLARVAPEHRTLAREAAERALHSATPVRVEFRVVDELGRTRWYATSERGYLDEHGEPAGIVGTTLDITEQKQVEQALRDSESRMRAIFEAEPECLKLMDAEGRLLAMNPAGLRMLEVDDLASVLGTATDAMVAPEQRAAFRAVRERVFAGESGSLEFEIVGLKGTRRLMESHLAPVRDAEGKVVAALAVTRDVSERRELEREIIEIANREQERIGHDLHDGLGQELTGIALMLRGLSSKLAREYPAALPSVEEIVRLVNRAIQGTRALAHGLSPVAIEHGGLEPALQALATRATDLYHLPVEASCESGAGRGLDASTAIHLYRIAQEAVTNAARHGRPTHVAITLAVSAGELVLSVHDDGVGMPADAAGAPGMGLRIMGYRARMVGGQLGIESRPAGGTTVRVTCPCGTARRSRAAARGRREGG